MKKRMKMKKMMKKRCVLVYGGGVQLGKGHAESQTDHNDVVPGGVGTRLSNR